MEPTHTGMNFISLLRQGIEINALDPMHTFCILWLDLDNYLHLGPCKAQPEHTMHLQHVPHCFNDDNKVYLNHWTLAFSNHDTAKMFTSYWPLLEACQCC